MTNKEEFDSKWKKLSLADALGESSLFKDGDWIESKDQDPNGDVRLIQLADIGDGFFRNRSDRYLTLDKALELNCTFLNKNDVLVARMPDPIGRACLFPGDKKKCVTAVDVCIIRTNHIDHQWLMYAINSPQFRSDVESLQSGSTRKRISRKNLAKIDVSIPARNEQFKLVEKIEELFSQLDAGVAGLKRAQAELQRYRASVLKAAFEGRLVLQDPNDEPADFSLKKYGKKPIKDNTLPKLPSNWMYTTLSDVAEINKRDYLINELPGNSQVSFVPMAAVDEYLGEIVNPEIRKLEDVRRGYTYFREGDVLFAKITPCMENGKAAIAKNLKNGIGFGSTEFHVFRTNDLILNQYLYYYIRQERFRNEAKANFTGTAGHMRVPSNFIKNYPIPVPPIDEQERIILKIESELSILEGIRNVIILNFQRSERLRQSILKRAFEGKL